MVGNAGSLPEGLKHLGDFEALPAIMAQHRPHRIIWAGDWPGQEDAVQKWEQGGIQVDSGPWAYEKLYLRVCSEGLPPSEILTSPVLAASPAMMSLQATYSNLVGLTLLITLLPLMLVLGILSWLAAGGRGSMMERTECAGFQGIPFKRLYFRTRNVKGEITWMGRLLMALRITGLPQLINLVRGDMAMFGPAPARQVFAQHLGELIPAYSHRLTMRPGLLGWAQVHLRPEQGVREEILQLEYDLYYIKLCSPSLDFEILLRTLLRVSHVPQRSRAA
jgi:lipopolysaccharide/colanic/teichoic acid biosynthesis glycosyltransferase